MTRAVFLSSGASRQRTVRATTELCRAAGIRRLELASGLPCDEDDLEHLLDLRREAGFEYLLHNYFPAPAQPFVLNLAAPETAELAHSIAHCRRAIDLCARLGAPFFSVHSGFAMAISERDLGNPVGWRERLDEGGADSSTARVVFAATVRDLADYAADREIRLLLENNVVAPAVVAGGCRDHGLLLSRGDEIATFLTALDHPNVGLLCDVAHARVSATALGFAPDEFMAAVEPWIEAFHLSDNDGIADTNSAFDASAWFVPWLRRVRDATIVVEVYALDASAARAQYQRVVTMCETEEEGAP